MKQLGHASEISPSEFDFVRLMVKQRSAICLDDSKGYLVSCRLLPIARAEGFESVSKLIKGLRSRANGPLHVKVVEAIATTETSFFRDLHPFAALREHILPELIHKRRQTTRMLNIWCAACSGGQEPYSVAMTLREVVPDIDSWAIQLMASDLSYAMVEKAREGIFQQLEVNRGLPARLLVRFFEQHDAKWHIKDEIRKMVTFFQHNLTDQWTKIPQIDLFLLRNVLIYFDVDTRRSILRQVRRHLKPDGYLVLGGAETTLSLDSTFKRVSFGRAALYQVGEDSGP
ncbi:MAG: protein-glutamate O-methyltransferase CheR [Thermoanaerobaculales bacterium]|nr:protein-glutamate O-methyltransferase CheR [Thermoanaerobaculales bacterium]